MRERARRRTRERGGSMRAGALLVLNAGSSSIKFALFAERGAELVPEVNGVAEGLAGTGEPRLVARRPDGAAVGERRWASGASVDHARALEALLALAREALGAQRIAAVGHRVVHG